MPWFSFKNPFDFRRRKLALQNIPLKLKVTVWIFAFYDLYIFTESVYWVSFSTSYTSVFFSGTASKERWLFVKQEVHEAMLTEKVALAAQAAGEHAENSAPWLVSVVVACISLLYCWFSNST